MGRLAGKNVLITGGNSGIGLAAAQEFDREGARVAICGLNEGTLRRAQIRRHSHFYNQHHHRARINRGL